jgi:hypothetical protein
MGRFSLSNELERLVAFFAQLLELSLRSKFCDLAHQSFTFPLALSSTVIGQ